MRVGDLVGSMRVDDTGRRLGKVHDVRLVQAGPLLRSNLAAFRLDGLLAGKGAIGTMFAAAGRMPLRAVGYATDMPGRRPSVKDAIAACHS